MATDQLTRTFAALADPTRRAILTTLRERGEASVAELATPFELTPRAISKHIGVLESAGLVSRGRDAQRRPSRLRVEPLVEVDAWLEDDPGDLGAPLHRARGGPGGRRPTPRQAPGR